MDSKRQDDRKKIKDSFDPSYSNDMIEHLEKVNMDPWFYIYSNYVNPLQKKDK